MANKGIDLDKKVAALQECLTLTNVQEVMDKYGFSERSAWYWYRRIIDCLPEILEKEKPGPKPTKRKKPPFLSEE